MDNPNFGDFINDLGAYEKALQEEYATAQAASDTNSVRKIIETKIAAALPGFVDDLILIARAGDTDSSRLKAIQFAFNFYFNESLSEGDPFTILLQELTNNDDPAEKFIREQMKEMEGE